MSITQARVHELFRYDDGKLIRKTTSGGQRAGSVVGCLSRGYLIAMVDRKLHKVHRLIFLMHHGFLPDEVDHRDLDRSNNRIANLRAADKRSNAWNCGKRSHNTSGYKGVSWDKKSQSWAAQIMAHQKRRYLGYFKTPEEAHAAYVKAACELHGEFARAA